MNEYSLARMHRDELMRQADVARLAGEARRSRGSRRRSRTGSVRWLASLAAQVRQGRWAHGGRATLPAALGGNGVAGRAR
jgi:hypothetical protein